MPSLTHLAVTNAPLTSPALACAAIERWIAKKRQDGLSLGYVKRMINTLKSILYDAKRDGQISENPASQIATIERGAFLVFDMILLSMQFEVRKVSKVGYG